MYRHGDVIIKKIKEVPENAKPKINDKRVLAYGEVTGHSHRFEPASMSFFEFDDRMFVNIQDELATLVHEEHKAFRIPEGTYEIIIQREYEPEGWKKVVD